MKTFRWIAVLPVSILMLILISSGALNEFQSASDVSETSVPWLFQIFIGICGSVAFIYSGFKTAPSHKKQTLIALSIILSLFHLFTFYYLWYGGIIIILRIIFSLLAIYLSYFFLVPTEEEDTI
jgi:O-antigen ligase